MTRLETERLAIRGFRPEDWRDLLEYLSLPETYRFEPGARRVVAFCDPRDPASWRVLERIGMRRKGHFREKAYFRRDEGGAPLWHDRWAYGMLEGDLKARPRG